MATKRKKKKKRNNAGPIIVIAFILLLIVAIAGGTVVYNKYSPSKEQADLNEYFGISASDQLAITINCQKSEYKATTIGNSVYLDYNFVHDYINSRFYWDANENVLLYTTANDLITAYADSTSYLVTKDSVEYNRPIVKANATSAWIEIDFVKQYSDFTYTTHDNPNRLVINSEWGDVSVATIKKNTSVRYQGGIKSDVLCDVPKGTKVRVLETLEDWTQVATDDGFVGYVRNKAISGTTTETLVSDYVPETFNHIFKDEEICLAWHQVTVREANKYVANTLASTKGINVISPTWFYINDNNGNIMNLASTDYVNYCHSQGVDVWGLVSNLENPNVDSCYVLTHTSTRQNLVNQVVSAAIQYNLDGINVDMEPPFGGDVGDSVIQFIRELSLKCEKNDLVLSVDNFAVVEYTEYFNRRDQADFADYVIIMGYDEHTRGSEEAGSVSSLNWVERSVDSTIAQAPANQVILGMPLYTRLWSLTENTEASDTELSYKLSSEIYGMSKAQNLVNASGAELQWLEDCGQYYAEWNADKTTYKIWLEDNTSLEERLKLMDEKGLAGAAFWKLGYETDNVWDTVIKYIN